MLLFIIGFKTYSSCLIAGYNCCTPFIDYNQKFSTILTAHRERRGATLGMHIKNIFGLASLANLIPGVFSG